MDTSSRELLEIWYRRLRESQFCHYESAKALERMNCWLGIPSVILSTVIGTSIFATLNESVNIRVQILLGLVSVVAAVLTGLQTFLRFSERSEKHRAVAARYGALRREIEEITLGEDRIPRELIAPLRESMDRLAEEAPNVSEGVWKKTKRILAKNSTSFLNRGKN